MVTSTAVTTVYLIIIVCLLFIQLVSAVVRRKRYVSAKELKSIEKHYIELLDVYHYVASNNIRELEKKVAELKTLLIQADQRIKSLTVLMGTQPVQGTYAPAPLAKQEKPHALPKPPRVITALEAEFTEVPASPPQVAAMTTKPEPRPIEPKQYRTAPEDPGQASLKLCLDEPVLGEYKDIVERLDAGIEVEEILKETKASRGVVTILANIRNLRRKKNNMREKGVRDED